MGSQAVPPQSGGPDDGAGEWALESGRDGDRSGPFGALFAANAAPILLIDPGADGAIVDANPNAAAFYGYSRERMRSLHVWDINVLGHAVLPAMHAIASWEGGHFPQRFRHRLADGSVRDVQVYAGPVVIAGRRLLLCIIHDITAVIEAEHFNRLLLESVQVGVCGIDRDGNFTFLNPVATRTFGFQHDSELIRGHIGAYLTGVGSGAAAAADWRTHPVGRVTEGAEGVEALDCTLYRHDGSPFPARLTASPIRNDQGFVGVVVSFTDRSGETERDAQLSDLTNALPGAVFQAELLPDGCVRPTYFSAAAAALFGLPAESTPTDWPSLSPIMSRRTWAGLRRALRRAGRDGTAWEQEGTVGLAEKRWLLGRALPRSRPDGTVTFNGVLLDITERRRLEAELEQAAQIDPLTGLWNRRRFQQALDEAAGSLRRNGRPYSLMLIDIDHFKRYNDTHGHQAGDEALRRVAATLAGHSRRLDGLARWGGEEFALLLPEAELDAAAVLAERLRSAVAALAGSGLPATISIGIGQAGIAEDADSLFRRVDAALYRAKAAGRNRVERA